MSELGAVLFECFNIPLTAVHQGNGKNLVTLPRAAAAGFLFYAQSLACRRSLFGIMIDRREQQDAGSGR